MRRYVLLWGVVLLGGAAAIGHAQGLQTGTRTVPAMFVACEGNTSPTPGARQEIEAAFGRLWTRCHASGLHPIGLPIVCLDLGTLPNGEAKWEAWVPLADALTADQLPQLPGLTLKFVPATPVAYTYYQGNPWEMGNTFADLGAWAGNHNVPVTTRARAIFYAGPFGKEPQDIITECQLEQQP